MGDRRIEAARRLAASLLEPSAARVEREGVPRAHLDALAAAGLLGLRAPVEAGGSAAPAPVVRAVAEILAGACPTTWLVQAQHHTPVALLAANDGPLQAQLLPSLAAGETIAGRAVAHIRRFPDRPVTAQRTARGWRLCGTAPWYTGWGLNDLAVIAGVDGDAHIVWAVVPARPQPGLRASEPIQTIAAAGALNVRLHLDRLWIPDSRVLARTPYATWQAQDRMRGADARPAVFGVTAAALNQLAATGEPDAVGLARLLRRRLNQLRSRCYRLADSDPHGRSLPARRAARAHAHALLTTATTAAVAAGGGNAVTPDAPAGRLARAGLLLLVHAQTPAARTATLRHWHHLTDPPHPSPHK